MPERLAVSICWCGLGFVTAVFADSIPVAVSPGDPARLVSVQDACPTFSWGGVDGVSGYELVVYRLGEEGEEAQPVLRREFTGSVSGWTPSLEDCLERGVAYVWSVRGIGRQESLAWSEPSLFRVAEATSETEFREALAVVREYLDARAESEAEAVAPGAGGAEMPVRDRRAVVPDRWARSTGRSLTPRVEPVLSLVGDIELGVSPDHTSILIGSWRLWANPTGFSIWAYASDEQVFMIWNGAPQNSLTVSPEGTVRVYDFERRCEGGIHDHPNGHCYALQTHTSAVGWPEAQRLCDEWGGYLATITSAAEQEFIEQHIVTFGSGQTPWIGYADARTEGVFEWVTGEPGTTGQDTVYSNWATDQPDDGGSGQDCVALRASDGKWNDVDCGSLKLRRICERDF